MPRSRESEMPQRASARGPYPLRTSSSDSDPLHHQSNTNRSLKKGDRRSPRGPHPDSVNQVKLGTRIADLECQLGQAQEELKILKEQLTSAETAKKEAQQALEKKTKKPSVPEPEEFQKKHPPTAVQAQKAGSNDVDEVYGDNQQETDVFEIPVEKKTVDMDQVEKQSKSIEFSNEPGAILELQKSSYDDDIALKDQEIKMLKANLEDKEKELEVLGIENNNLKNQLTEVTSSISSARAKETEMSLRLNQFGEELEGSKANEARLKEKLEASEEAKEALEAEMKKMRVQTEQWKKAADAAAAVLAGGAEMNGRISGRCGSMDKHFSGIFDGGFTGFMGSPDLDDGFKSGKPKGAGIKMFGDLWKKKGQK